MKVIPDPASSRGFADHGWLRTFHTFSFADYFNPARMQFGALRVLNDDTVAPGAGFGTHPHKNMEVVSIPLHGALRHGDNLRNSHVIRPGEIQVMSAGRGIEHSEYNASDTEPVQFLQIWIIPDTLNTEPRYADYDIKPYLRRNETSTFISPGGAVSLRQEAWFSMLLLDEGAECTYELYGKDTGVYAFVISGTVDIGAETLHARDGAGVLDARSVPVLAIERSEVLLIEVPV